METGITLVVILEGQACLCTFSSSLVSQFVFIYFLLYLKSTLFINLHVNGYLASLLPIFPTSPYLLYLLPPSLRFLAAWSLSTLLANLNSLHLGCTIINCSINTKFSEKEHTFQSASISLQSLLSLSFHC